MFPALLPFLAALSLGPRSGTAPVARIPFELVNKAIFVRVTVNDRPLWFLLDTGLQPSVIDLQVAQSVGLELGDPAAVVGAGQDSVTARFLKHAEVRLAGLEASGEPLLLALPLENLASRIGHPLAGLLGSGFVRRFVIAIDYRAHTLTLQDTTGFTYSGTGEILPITFNASGHPLVAAEVVDGGRPAMPGRFVLDIGSGAGLILNTPFVAQGGFLTPDRRTVRWIEGQGVGGEVAGVVGRVSGLRLGHFWLNRPVTVFARVGSGPLASPDAEGDIGAGILEKFTLILDYARMRIILEPNAGFPETMEYNRTGFTLSASGPDYRTYTVAAVAEDSPASDAGLQVGDTLLTIDGHPAGERTLSDLRLALRVARRCRLTVQRAAARVALRLTLRNAI